VFEPLRAQLSTFYPQFAIAFSRGKTHVVSSANDIPTIWGITNLPDNYETSITENRYISDLTGEQRARYISAGLRMLRVL
jgi:hypothetical protein